MREDRRMHTRAVTGCSKGQHKGQNWVERQEEARLRQEHQLGESQRPLFMEQG